ncbi:MAG: hypothetical protein JSS34_03465 [Proteobacteria bacterium]|nr:hypothetical protein [Pseudomonadota bacterium]
MTFLKKIQDFSIKDLLFLMGIFALFFLPFLYVWAGFPFFINEDMNYVMLGGVIPYSDAGSYYAGAELFLRTGEIDYWNMRRPLNALLLAIRLKIVGGDFQGALFIQAALCGLSGVFFVQTVSQILGRRVAFISILICFLWAQTYIPTTMTESLGLCLGFLAITLLIQGTYLESASIFGVGIFVLTVGLNTRAGPFIILPFFFLWVLFSPLFKAQKKWAFFLIAGIILGFLYPKALLLLYGTSEGTGQMHANFASTLYGLARGGLTWVSGYEACEKLGITVESEQAIWLYQESLRLILENPLNLIKGLFLNLCRFLKFFLNIKYVFGFFSYPIDWIFVSGLPFVLYYYFLCGKSFIRHYHSFQKISDIILIGVLGSFFSAAVTFDSGGIRTFAVTMPFIALALGMPFVRFSQKNSDLIKKQAFFSLLSIFLILAAGLILPSLIASKNKSSFSSQSRVKEMSHNLEDRVIEVRRLKSYPFLYVEDNPSKKHRRPTISAQRLSDLKNLETFFLREDLEHLKSHAPYTLGLVFDEKTYQSFLIVGPLGWDRKENQMEIQELSIKHKEGFSEALYFLKEKF